MAVLQVQIRDLSSRNRTQLRRGQCADLSVGQCADLRGRACNCAVAGLPNAVVDRFDASEVDSAAMSVVEIACNCTELNEPSTAFDRHLLAPCPEIVDEFVRVSPRGALTFVSVLIKKLRIQNGHQKGLVGRRQSERCSFYQGIDRRLRSIAAAEVRCGIPKCSEG